MLEIIGLTAEVGQVYDAMLDAGTATARELATTTGLNHGAVRAALRRLEAHGLVAPASQSPLAFTATDPSIALETLLLTVEEELREARLQAQQLSDRFRQAVSRRDAHTVVEVVSAKAGILQRIVQLERSARRELRYFDKPPYHSEPLGLNPAELDLLSRGGQVRAIYETAAIRIPDRMPQVSDHVRAGEQARVLPDLPTKMFVVDERLAVMPLYQHTNAVPSPSFVIIQRSALLDTLIHLFETLWQLALPLELATTGQQSSAEPEPLERMILGLMNAGLPDEAIARHLNLSHRTLQRRIRDLMQRLQAHTRYQLGAQVAARGWHLPTESPGGQWAGGKGHPPTSGTGQGVAATGV